MKSLLRAVATCVLAFAIGPICQPAPAQPLKPAGGFEPLHGPPLEDDGGLSDPVFLFNGEFHLSETDLIAPGVGLDFVVQREYRSRMGRRDQLQVLFGEVDDRAGLGTIGRNWTLSLDQSVAVAGRHEIDFFAEGGRRITFSRFAMPWGLEGGPGEVPPERGWTFEPIDWCELECPDGAEPVMNGPYDCQCFGGQGGGQEVVTLYPVECGTGLVMRVVYYSGVVTEVQVLYPDGSQREFIGAASLDASGTNLNAEAQTSWGKLRTIRDANHNTIRFSYIEGHASAGAGLLSSVTDTVGRVFELDWLTPEGGPRLLARIRDVSGGRQVEYTYVTDPQDPDGNLFDLKAVTQTPIAGHPLGRKWSYTYFRGSGHADSNLRTITDPNGRVVLQNEYYTGTSEPNGYKDGVKRQVVGDGESGDAFNYAYFKDTTSGLWGATVNNREGFVKEVWFDSGNRMVRRTDFTGRAPIADSVSRSFPPVLNMPTAPLRGGDPASYTTTMEYTECGGLLRAITRPGGLRTEYEYAHLLGDSPFRSTARTKLIRKPAGTVSPPQPSLWVSESWTYEHSLGPVRRTNLPTSHTDALGRTTVLDYIDPLGNPARACSGWCIPKYRSLEEAHRRQSNDSAMMREDGRSPASCQRALDRRGQT